MLRRSIIHLDLDAFFCAVEEQREPALVGTPFAVGGRPETRGVVASCSYAARQFGVHSAMPMARAVRQCPGLIVVPPDFPAYRAASQQVMERLRAVTPLVEQISIDEAFLEVTGLPEPVDWLATRLQNQIRDELGLSCSVGVATNKLVAKIATDAGKAAARAGRMPRAICMVPPGEEALFLAPMAVTALWGVGEKTAARLAALGIHTIGELAAWPAKDLTTRFGQHGADLARHARGLDDRELVTERASKSISQETTFARDVREVALLQETLRVQAATIAGKLQRKGLVGTTVKLKLRWPDFTTPTRQMTLTQPAGDAEAITAAGLRLLHVLWPIGQPVRLIGIGISGLGSPPRQLSLWDQTEPAGTAKQRVAAALAVVEARFGDGAIRRGSDLGQVEPAQILDIIVSEEIG
jgi:DNA polymerase-4